MKETDTAQLLAAYYAAPGAVEQERVIAALGKIAGAPSAKPAVWVPAVQALIELLHVVRHPRARVRLVRGFAQCFDRAFAVPALLAELDDDDAQVIEAALWALGRIGVHFAGAAVANWLDGCDLDTLPEPVLDRALLTLAEIGAPDAPKRAEACFDLGQITPRVAHLVMAESVSPRMTDAALRHLADPSCARAAALHLAMIGHPDLDTLLAERMTRAGTELSLVMHQLLEPRRGRKGGGAQAGDLLLDAVTHKHPIRRRRLARRLRALDLTDVIVGFAEVAELVAVADGDLHPTDLIAAALNAGIPALQDAVLDYAADNAFHLQFALRHVHSPTQRLLAGLQEWSQHENTWVAVNAVRAWSGVSGPDGLSAIDHLKRGERHALRVEWVRAQQNAWMLRRDTKGRIPVDHHDRQDLVREIRHIVQTEPPPLEREMALYLVGNLDLNELADALLDTFETQKDTKLRRAAAISMGELELPRLLEHYPELIAKEPEDDVLFGLFRAALRTLRDEPKDNKALAAAVRKRLEAGLPPRLECPALALLGRCRDRESVTLLTEHAGTSAQLASGAAITALGDIGEPKGLGALIDASRHPELERRVWAATALGGVGGEIAEDRLISMLDNETELAVRRAALGGLERCHPSQTALEHLTPTGPDDTLGFEILRLHLSVDQAQTGVDTDTIDARLRGAVPNFSPKRIAAASPDALEALRAAEYLSGLQAQLPAGLDASAPVLLWNKGLELWLNHLLRQKMIAFIEAGGTSRFDALTSQWWKLQPTLAPKWRNDLLRKNAGELWDGLARSLQKQLSWRTDVTRRSQSLGCIATLLLICGVPWKDSGFHWKLGISTADLQSLANALVALARQRNRLTHQRAGDVALSADVRAMALEAVGIVCRMRVG